MKVTSLNKGSTNQDFPITSSEISLSIQVGLSEQWIVPRISKSGDPWLEDFLLIYHDLLQSFSLTDCPTKIGYIVQVYFPLLAF